MEASFEERSIWIQLIATVAAIGGYFVAAWFMHARGVHVLIPYVPLFLAAAGVMAVVLVLGHILAAVLGRCEARDERDRLIAWRAESNSAWVVALGVFAAIACMVLSVSTVLVAHVLLLSMFLAQVLQFGLQIWYYRAGM